MEKKRIDNIKVEDARILFRNFAGRETKFNREGNRNFCLILDRDISAKLIEDGWNVKIIEPKDEYEDPLYYLQVAVNFDNVPPMIFMMSSNAKVQLDEDTVGMLDTAEIKNVDLIVRPYIWEVNGKTGVKAYLKTMYVTIEEDEFARKYDRKENDDGLPF